MKITKLLDIEGGETTIKEEIDLKIEHLDNVEDFIKKAEENKKVIIDVIGKEGNILDKRVLYVFLSLDGNEIYYVNEDELPQIKTLLSNPEIKKHGYDISFKKYFKLGFPVMLLTIFISTIYLLLRY